MRDTQSWFCVFPSLFEVALFVVAVVAVAVVAFAAEVAALAVAGSGVKVRPGSSTAINCLNRKMFFFSSGNAINGTTFKILSWHF